MLRLAASLIAFVVASGCAGSRPAVEAPFGWTGAWAGEGRQWNDGDRTRPPDERWTVRVAVSDVPGATGVTSTATIEYPELGCGGTLEFVGPNTAADAQAGDRIYRETITTGTDRCVTGGTVLLRPSRNSLLYAWAMDGRATVASARLERQR